MDHDSRTYNKDQRSEAIDEIGAEELVCAPMFSSQATK